MSTPQVSIITPNFNGAEFIGQCMTSVQAQSFSDWEHIIVDDASSDDSVTIIEAAQKKDSRIRLIAHNKNSGPRHARNEASNNACGRYIAFLDSDDYWLPMKLELQLAMMQAQDTPISGVAYEVHDLYDNCLRRRRMPKSISYSRLLYANLLSASTVLYDTHYFGRVLNSCPWGDEDHHLWLEMLRVNCIHAAGLDTVLAVLRQRPKSRSSDKLQAIQRRWQTYRKAQQLSLGASCFWFGCYATEAIMHRLLVRRKSTHVRAR